MPPSSWTVEHLGALCKYYKGGSPFAKLEYVSSGIPVLAKGDIKPFGRLEFSGKRFMDPAVAEQKMLYVSRPGDLLMTTRDLTQAGDVLGLVAPIPGDNAYLVNQGANVIRIDDSRLDVNFLVLWTNAELYRAHMKSRAVGSTQLHIQKSAFMEAPIWLPPLPEQRRIASVLGALIDKIELNRKMNRTLEEIAQALFKSWFIDFDGHDDLVASELGPIPRGWKPGTPLDLIDFNPFVPLVKSTVAPYVEMKALSTSGPTIEFVERKDFTSGSKFMRHDTLLARITPCLENGKTAFVDILDDGEIGFGSTEFIVMRRKPPVPAQWVYLLARSEAFRGHAITNMTGSSGRQRVPVDCFVHFALAVPPESVLVSFGQIVEPLLARIGANAAESRALAELRDLLLPKLISGELRVPEAAELIESAP